MTEEEEYGAKDARRFWPDNRVLRLIRQGFVYSARYGQNEVGLMRLLQYMRDDYEELLEKNRVTERRHRAVFEELLSKHTNYVGMEEEKEEWRDEWGW